MNKTAEALTRRDVDETVQPIILHLNDQFHWEAAMDQNADLPNGHQHTLLSLRAAEDELRMHLTEYIDAWLAMQCKFLRWDFGNKALSERLNGYLQGMDFLVLPADEGKATLLPFIHPGIGVDSARREAAWLFARLITSPLYRSIGKCPSCARYFAETRGYHKQFCSRKCSTGFTARRTMKTKRQSNQAMNIKKAQLAVKEFASLQIKEKNWKVWVANQTGLTKNWLTRAAKRGTLALPAEVATR